MNESHLKGKVQTVLGMIAPGQLGVTLPHEHLICDGTVWCHEPEEASERRLVNHPVTQDILWWLRYHPFQNRDDLQLLDEQTTADEVIIYKAHGGRSIVEVTVRGLGPDPQAVARISRVTGINVIKGTAYYVEQSYPADIDMNSRSEEEIAEDEE